ncbi:hypothetical protein D3C87_1622200 [compost metagenome]
MLAGQFVEVTVGRIHIRLDVVLVERWFVIQVDAWRRSIDLCHGRLRNRRGGPFRRVRHHAVRRRQRHRWQVGLFAGGFQYRLDRWLLSRCRLDRVIPRQVDHFFDHNRFDHRLGLDDRCNRLRHRGWSHRRGWRDGGNGCRCNGRSDYRRNNRRGSH